MKQTDAKEMVPNWFYGSQFGRVYFVPVIEGTAARREHNLTKLVSIGEMLLVFGNDELCSRRAAPATETT